MKQSSWQQVEVGVDHKTDCLVVVYMVHYLVQDWILEMVHVEHVKEEAMQVTLELFSTRHGLQHEEKCGKAVMGVNTALVEVVVTMVVVVGEIHLVLEVVEAAVHHSFTQQKQQIISL
jgi:hypothetical protein